MEHSCTHCCVKRDDWYQLHNYKLVKKIFVVLFHFVVQRYEKVQVGLCEGRNNLLVFRSVLLGFFSDSFRISFEFFCYLLNFGIFRISFPEKSELFPPRVKCFSHY